MKMKNAILGGFLIALFAGIITWIVYNTSSFPLGSDVYGHLFKIRSLYEEIGQGNFFPVYIKNWYSGTEVFRFSPALSYYIMCLFMEFTAGNIYTAYVVFIFFAFILGGTGWLLFGIRENKVWLSVALGMLYIVLPDNMRVFFEMGNVPRMMATMLIPWIIFFVYDYLYHDNKKALIPLNIFIVIISATHITVAIMIFISVMILCFFYYIIYKEAGREIKLLLNMLFAYLEAGFILVPGLIDGFFKKSETPMLEKGTSWSQSALISLNPFTRSEDLNTFYFGLSLFLLIVIGLLAMRKATVPLFATGFAIFLGTTLIALPIISAVSLDETDYVLRFVPVAEVLILLGIICWKELKKKAVLVILLIIALDSAFSVKYIVRTKENYVSRETRQEETSLFAEAVELTDNRMAVMDLNLWDSYPSYALTKDGRDVDSLFGWSDQGVFTTKEIASLNDAFSEGFYYYAFDRLYIYGCDVVVVNRDALIAGTGEERMRAAAEDKGYYVATSNDQTIVLKHNNVRGQYGTYDDYENVCIGESAEYISYLYPSFYKLTDESLDAYTFDDLKKYKKIFLSGPTYGDKEHAEELVQQLSDAGVKIFIDMNNLQDDKPIGRNSFLGVVAQPITFHDSFPIIEKSTGSQFKLPFKSEKYGAWRTVYFTNLENVTRRTQYSKGKFLDYLGNSPNRNITFIGLNLVYYCKESSDNDNLYSFLDEIFEESRTETPDHGYVPINVQVAGNQVKIVSPKSGVLTSVANLESFVSESNLGRERFVKVDEGTTKMRLKRAYMSEGIICSIAGLLLAIYSWFLMGVWRNEE